MDYEKSYKKTLDLLEEKILESTNLEVKMNWIDTYKQVVKPEDQNEEVLDITQDLYDLLKEPNKNVYVYKLPEKFMVKYKDELNWGSIAHRQDLSREFILKMKDLIPFDNLNLKNYMKLEDNDLRSLSSEINWDYISMRDDLSTMFVREFKDKLNWSYVTINISFTEDEMEEFSEFIDWKMVTICQVYSDEFKEKHELNQYLDEMKSSSKELVGEHQDRMDKKKTFYGNDEEGKIKHYQSFGDMIKEAFEDGEEPQTK